MDQPEASPEEFRKAAKKALVDAARSELNPTQRTEGTLGIVISNVLTIVLAVIFKWPIGDLLVVFWVQSVVIGYYSYHRIRGLKEFSTAGFKINNRSVQPTEKTKRDTAVFFAIHFGIFHVVYLAFLASDGAFSRFGVIWLLLTSLSFVYSHRQSYLLNRAADQSGKPNIGTMMFLPYARVFPMHLMIIGGRLLSEHFNLLAVLAFGALKLGADVLMHVVEHKALRKGK